jgi:hypothetical protein
MVGDAGLVDLAGRQFTAGHLLSDSLHGIDHLGPATVVDRQAQPRTRIAGTQADRLVHLLLDSLRDAVPAADDIDDQVVAHDPIPLVDHVLLQQMHQEIQFVLRAFPVLAGQAVQRQLLDAQTSRFLDVARTLATPWRCPSMRGRLRC